MKGSLGLIETRGLVPAIAAADAGVKAANVSLLECKLTWPALVTITFQGDVAAVQAAVASGSAVANSLGEVVSTHVIARPYAVFDQVTPTPFTGQEDEPAGQKQEKVVPVETVSKEIKTKPVSKRTVKKQTAPKKVAAQAAKKSVQAKARDVEAGVHDTDTTDKQVAASTGPVEKRTEKKAEEGAQHTQKTGAARSATKTAQRKRAVGSRKRPVRKRQATTSKTTAAASSATSTAEKKQAATGGTSPEKSSTKPTDKK